MWVLWTIVDSMRWRRYQKRPHPSHEGALHRGDDAGDRHDTGRPRSAAAKLGIEVVQDLLE
jgi:hypothetical protein